MRLTSFHVCLTTLAAYCTHSSLVRVAALDGNMLLHAPRRSFQLDITKNSSCSAHQLVHCPACQPTQYMKRRVVKAVTGSVKRMGLQKKMPILTYLGADSWIEVLESLEAKRESWNLAHPDKLMTLTNTAIDHIRPVRAFTRDGVGACTFLCNHYTNLQPLLHEDNAWKGDCWSPEDERFWNTQIVLQKDFDCIYYPKAAPAQPSLLVLHKPETILSS
jgi:hypothetical protein